MTEEPEKEIKDSPAFKKFIIGAVFAVLIFFAILYYMKYFLPEKPLHETLTYNNFIFEEIDNIWFTTWQRGEQPYRLAFRFNPEEVEAVPVEGWIDESFNQPELFITFNLTDDTSEDNAYMALAASELALSAVRAMNRSVISACMQNRTFACSNRSIVTCANKDLSVVEIVPAAPTYIAMQENCIRIQGEGEELVRAVDKVLYYWYRIITP